MNSNAKRKQTRLVAKPPQRFKKLYKGRLITPALTTTSPAENRKAHFKNVCGLPGFRTRYDRWLPYSHRVFSDNPTRPRIL